MRYSNSVNIQFLKNIFVIRNDIWVLSIPIPEKIIFGIGICKFFQFRSRLTVTSLGLIVWFQLQYFTFYICTMKLFLQEDVSINYGEVLRYFPWTLITFIIKCFPIVFLIGRSKHFSVELYRHENTCIYHHADMYWEPAFIQGLNELIKQGYTFTAAEAEAVKFSIILLSDFCFPNYVSREIT